MNLTPHISCAYLASVTAPLTFGSDFFSLAISSQHVLVTSLLFDLRLGMNYGSPLNVSLCLFSRTVRLFRYISIASVALALFAYMLFG